MPEHITTQDEWNRRRVDIRHINPSIMEGERGHTSLFGHGSAVPIVRYAPVFLVQPSISGSPEIPSILTCNPGVIDASPQANIFYQWQANGIDIPGETQNTIITTLDFDGVILTCEITAVNFLGSVMGESNGITGELVEPIINQENTYFAVTGLNQKTKTNATKSDTFIVTGTAQPSRFDMEQYIILIGSGLWVESRNDVFSETNAVITGLGGNNGLQAYHGEAYTFWQPTRLANVPIINPSAETGDMTGWTVTQGTIVATSIAQQGTSIPYVSKPWYFGSHTAGKTNCSMFQIVDLDPVLNTDIDAGLILSKLLYRFDTYTNNFGHQLTSSFQMLDASNNVLFSEPLYFYKEQNDPWTYDYTELVYLPPSTRKLRMTFNFLTDSGWDNHVYLDEIEIEMFKDERQP